MGFTKYKPEGPRKANFLGGGKEAPKNENWHESPKVEAQESPEKEEGGVFHGPLPLEGIYKAMNMGVFQKGGLFQKNSDYYNAVVTDLARVIGSWGVSLSEDRKQIYQSFASTENYYRQLIDSCEKYLARRSLSSQGKARQEIIANILEQAETDLRSLKSYFGQYLSMPESERAGSVKDALVVARRKKLVMKKSDAEHKHVGGAASRLTVLEEGDIEGSNTSGFFKEEEIFTNHGKRHQLELPKILERARRISPISNELYKEVYDYFYQNYITSEKDMQFDGDGYLPGMKNVREVFTFPGFKAFYKTVVSLCKSWWVVNSVMMDDESANVGLEEGNSTSLTNRNVASSRMAEALGVGNLIAKSETVELVDSGQKKGRMGNLMQKAEGKEAAQIQEEYKRKAVAEQLAAGIDTDDFEDSDLLAKKVSGNFQKQLSSLQVLDYLAGQVDRHEHNYFVQQDKDGMLTGVTGIDNDLSFGNAKVKQTNCIGNNGYSPVNQKGELILPHMDKTLAQNILALSKEELTFLLADLLKPKEIGYACERLETLKKAITEELQKKDSTVFVEKAEDWNEKTLEDFTKGHNYMRRFLNDMSAFGIFSFYHQTLKSEKYYNEAEKLWNEMVKNCDMSSPDKIFASLNANGFKTEGLSNGWIKAIKADINSWYKDYGPECGVSYCDLTSGLKSRLSDILKKRDGVM